MTLKLSTDVQAPKCADKFCSFGIIEGVGAALAGALGSAGVGAATAAAIGTVGSYAVVGAGVGALTAAVTGGKVLKGAGYGALAGLGLGTGAVAGGLSYEGGLSALVGGGTAAGAAAEGAGGAGAAGTGAAGAGAGLGAGEAATAAAPSLAGASGEVAGALSSAPIGTGGGALAAAAPEVASTVAPAVATAAPSVAAPTLAQIGTPSILSGAQTVAAAPAGLAGIAPEGLAAYGGGQGGILATLGLTKGDLIKGALSGFGSMMSGGQRPPPGPESTAATRGPYFDRPMQSTGYVNRQVNQQYQPAGGDWYHFGEKPQQNFYTNNRLDLGYARGGALSTRGRRMPQPPPQQNPNRYVSGGGDGVSDDVPAQLSDGEYVLTAADVSRIGNGSSQAGVKKLDRMRQMVAKDAGARKIQGRVKEPQSYLRQAAMGR